MDLLGVKLGTRLVGSSHDGIVHFFELIIGIQMWSSWKFYVSLMDPSKNEIVFFKFHFLFFYKLRLRQRDKLKVLSSLKEQETVQQKIKKFIQSTTSMSWSKVRDLSNKTFSCTGKSSSSWDFPVNVRWLVVKFFPRTYWILYIINNNECKFTSTYIYFKSTLLCS